ncbi:hypothetical protein TNCV_4994141 [Trichonephila clavipes]|nr:hypothetical protein TNCV_4994141 [Trichonephila clavipes]
MDNGNIKKIVLPEPKNHEENIERTPESSRQRSSTLRFQTPNGILRSRRSRMGLYSTVTSKCLVGPPVDRYPLNVIGCTESWTRSSPPDSRGYGTTIKNRNQ